MIRFVEFFGASGLCRTASASSCLAFSPSAYAAGLFFCRAYDAGYATSQKRALPLEMPARDGAKPRQERVPVRMTRINAALKAAALRGHCTGNTRALVWFIPAVVPCRRIRMRNLFREAYENAMLKRAVHFGVRARETSVLGCGHADISTV